MRKQTHRLTVLIGFFEDYRKDEYADPCLFLLLSSPSGEAELRDALKAGLTKSRRDPLSPRRGGEARVRIQLFGGTAASYAHYVKNDNGTFDYDYYSIFRSTQDLDIVVDGSAEQVKQLQANLERKFPHFKGSKSRGK